MTDPTAQTWSGTGGWPDQVIVPTAFPITVLQGGTSITISWSTVTGALYYDIYAGISPSTMNVVKNYVTATTYTLSNLALNKNYYVQVVARLANNYCLGSVVETQTTTGSVFFGFVATTSPSGTDIENLAVSANTGYAGTYVLTQTGASAQYPALAFPTSYGVPSQFTYGGLVVAMQQTSITINGVAYNVFLNPYATYATSATFVVS